MKLRSPNEDLDTVLFLTGYGDNTLNIKLLTWHWPHVYGVKPLIHQCGTNRPASEYPKLLEEAEEKLKATGRCVVAGQSFGGVIGAILLDKYPELTAGLMMFSTPLEGAITREARGRGEFSLLNRARQDVNTEVFTEENTLAWAGSTDGVAPPPTMLPKNATTEQLWVPTHGAAIAAALLLKASEISDFAHQRLHQ